MFSPNETNLGRAIVGFGFEAGNQLSDDKTELVNTKDCVCRKKLPEAKVVASNPLYLEAKEVCATDSIGSPLNTKRLSGFLAYSFVA